MARNNYLVNGVSGTGKTAVGVELRRRGYRVLDADTELAYFGDPVTLEPIDEQTQRHWMWNEERTLGLLADGHDAELFVCGGAVNEERFRHLFRVVFTLVVDDGTLWQRLTTRPDEGLCKDPDYLAAQLVLNQTEPAHARTYGSTLVDASRPLAEVVDEILAHVRGIGSNTDRS